MKYLKLFESFNYNLKVFTQNEFTDFYVKNYGYDYNLSDRIEYFSYDDLSHIFGNDDYNKSLRFIVAYNDKDILGIAKYAYYSMQKRYGVSFISTNNSFLKRGISENLVEEMLRYFSEHNKDEILGMSEYSITGWHSLRHNFRKFAKKYGVKVKEQKIGYGIKTDDDLDLYNQSKKEIQELYPGTYPEMKLESVTNFEKWFGNSKVVNEQGKPLVVYHGTTKDFEKFKEKTGKKSKSKQQMDFGIHFSENPKDSEIYTKNNGTIYPVYLKIENPLDLTKGTWWNDDPDFDKMVLFAEKILKVSRLVKRKQVFSKYNKNGEIIDGIGNVVIVQNMLDKISPSKVYDLVTNNFDGIIYQPYQIQGFNTFTKFAKSYIVFSPTQIKSVANIGSYDLRNPLMLESKNNSKTITGYRNKKSNIIGEYGTWYYPENSPVWNFHNIEKYYKKTVNFKNILKIPNSELDGYEHYVIEYLIDIWIDDNYFDEWYKKLEKESEEQDIEIGVLEMREIMKETIKRGYDGIEFGNHEFVYYENEKMLENKNTIMKRDDVIKMIKEDLTDYDDVTWEQFVDNQELGECQSIVSSIERMNITGVESHFGEIEIVNFPTDEDYYGKIMTHHWITFLGEVFEFSKGTLSNYIDWNDLYDVDDEGEVDYSGQIMIKESLETPELASGKAAFKIFLKIINSNDNLFSTKNYLNKGKYLYFFYTDSIQNNEDIIDELEVRTSLETAYKTIYKLKDKRLSFFFAIDEFKLFYGFYDDTTHLIYKIGKYNVHDTDLRNLPDLDCLKKVNDVLIPDVDIKKRRFLNEIKEDFKKLFPKTNSKIEVTSSTVVKKEVELNKFKEGDQDYDAMSVTLDRFAENFDWYDKVHTYIEIDEQNVIFYIKVV